MPRHRARPRRRPDPLAGTETAAPLLEPEAVAAFDRALEALAPEVPPALAQQLCDENVKRQVMEALREHFLTADMGISGSNFVIAETGTTPHAWITSQRVLRDEQAVLLAAALDRLPDPGPPTHNSPHPCRASIACFAITATADGTTKNAMRRSPVRSRMRRCAAVSPRSPAILDIAGSSAADTDIANRLIGSRYRICAYTTAARAPERVPPEGDHDVRAVATA